MKQDARLRDASSWASKKGGLLQAGGLGDQASPQAGLCFPPAAREDSLTPHLFNSSL